MSPALSGIVDYEPAELVLTAQPATPLAEIEAALAAQRQMLAFEPPDWRGAAGRQRRADARRRHRLQPLRPAAGRAGAARDHLLGFAAVNGRGEICKAGGKVVKNVTGYDLCKLMAGAFGTLVGADRGDAEGAAAARDRMHAAAAGARRRDRRGDDGAGAQHAVRGLRRGASAGGGRAPLARRRAGRGAVTALRLEGPAPSVAYRAEALRDAARPRLAARGRRHPRALWAEIGEVAPLLPPAGRVIWRLCPTPSGAARRRRGDPRALARRRRLSTTGAAAWSGWPRRRRGRRGRRRRRRPRAR